MERTSFNPEVEYLLHINTLAVFCRGGGGGGWGTACSVLIDVFVVAVLVAYVVIANQNSNITGALSCVCKKQSPKLRSLATG